MPIINGLDISDQGLKGKIPLIEGLDILDKGLKEGYVTD